MIHPYDGSQHVEGLVNEVLQLPHIASLRRAKDLHVYGIIKERGVDIAIPREFPNSSKLITEMKRHFGDLMILPGSFWSFAQEYGYQCIGLGARIRADEKALCKISIVTSYLWLNELVDIGATINPRSRAAREASAARPSLGFTGVPVSEIPEHLIFTTTRGVQVS